MDARLDSDPDEHRETLSFGERLRRDRLERGLTQEELAERAGLSVRGLSDLERGIRRAPYPDTVQRLAEALGLSAAERAALLAGRPRVGRQAGARAYPAQARREEPSAVLPAPRLHNLPAQLPSLIGRADAVATVHEHLLRTESGLLTLTGAGGSGKTRLALAVGAQLLDGTEFPDGVWLVDLAPLSDPGPLASAVAASLGIREQPGRPTRDTLLERLAARSLLLILDNCEHLVEACAALVADLLRGCSGLRVLATSRERLRIPGERTWPVPTLAAPDRQHLHTIAQLSTFPAVSLFVERAQAVRPGFELTAANSVAVAQICARLDGLPLALELAAARVRVLAPEQILERLEHTFTLLAGGSRTAPLRQQSLRAALDWSYYLLTPAEQESFRSLAVFAGGFDLDAATAVWMGGVEGDAVGLDVLTGLVDQSLVLAEPEAGAMRYRLLEPVRQYAQDRLATSDALEATHRRHAEHFLTLAERADRELEGPVGPWLQRLEVEHHNLRVALAWALGTGEAELGLRLAAALWRFSDMHSHVREGLSWLTRALELPGASRPSPARAQALTAAGHLALLLGEQARAQHFLEQSLVLWRELEEHAGAATALFFLGLLVGWLRGELDAAALLLEKSLRLANEAGPRWVTFAAPVRLADLARAQGDYERAEALLADCCARTEAEGDPWSLALALRSWGYVRLQRGDATGARRLFAESLDLARLFEDVRGISQCLDGLACVAAARGQALLAARLFGAAEGLRERLGTTFPIFLQATQAWSARLSSRPDRAARVAAAWADGRALSVEQAIGEALGQAEASLPFLERAQKVQQQAMVLQNQRGVEPSGRSHTRPDTAGADVLSARELEVAALVATGMSNRAVAEALVITESTAEVHLKHILSKLGFRSRAQIAVWAAQRGLIADSGAPR